MKAVLSQPTAALIVALANLILAAILLVTANKTSAAEETAAVAEVRDMALEDIEAEVRLAAEEAQEAANALKKMARDPLRSIAPGVAGSVAKAGLKNLKN